MKALLLDIETAPNIVHVWGLWQQNVGLNQILDSGYVMCWAAKWLGKDEVMFDSVHLAPTKKKLTDKQREAKRKAKAARMLNRIHKLIDEADYIIHYNGTKFDMPTLNKEFILHGMSPPAPYKQVDLCNVAKREFRFASNKLDYVAQALGLGSKAAHEGHALWVKCMNDDPEAWQRMERYNKNDVTLLEGVYLKMRPWIRLHPNFGVYDEPGVPVCTNCGSSQLQRRGYARTQVNKYARFQCTSCGSWMRGALSELNKEDRQLILRRDHG